MSIFSRKKFCILKGADDTAVIVNLDNLSCVCPYYDDNGVTRGYKLILSDGGSVVCFGEFKNILSSLLSPVF